MRRSLHGATICWLCLLLLPTPASAQNELSANLSVPNIDAFPIIEAYLDVYDAQGNFVDGLQAEQVRVLEDRDPIPVSELRELRRGVQIVVALNPGPPLGTRNSQGVSRYDNIKDALREWAKSRVGSTLDDLSLTITQGPSISHVTEPTRWITALDSDQIDARLATPSLDTLFHAVNLAADITDRPGMGRVVVFITPPPEAGSEQSLENLAAQANEQGIVIFTWVVSSKGGLVAKSIEQLNQLAVQTGGKHLNYTGEEVIPSLEEYLEPLRTVYQLSYQSKVAASGAHQLAAEVQFGFDQVETNTQNFEIEIQPPQPAFVAPPIQIQRKPQIEGDSQIDGAGTPVSFSLNEQVLQVVFDFPDGRKRALAQTTLFVDDVAVVKNLEPPFDQFTWNLEEYTEDGVHNLRVEAIDTLGLTGNSIEVPIQVLVEKTERDSRMPLEINAPMLIALTVLLVSAVLLLILVIGGRLRPSTLRLVPFPYRKSDTRTQTVQIKNEPGHYRLSHIVNRLQWSQRHVAPKAYAFLNPITDTEISSSSPPIPITTNIITIGRDKDKVVLVIDDPSIEPIHARLQRQSNGSFRLADEGSIAGTWVNFTPVSQEGIKLEHGDLVHIGGIGFHFAMHKPNQIRKPVVILESPQEGPIKEPLL